jgi:predicted DNA binding protein
MGLGILSDIKKNLYVIEGNDECIEEFFNNIRVKRLIKDIKIKKLEDKEFNIISDLTKNQKKILNYAKKYGYYDYPRKITSEELSKKTGIDKDEILENLRRTEKHIVTKILENNNI